MGDTRLDCRPEGGVDAVDPSKVHEPHNLVTCCLQCNVGKNDYSVEQTVDHAKRVVGRALGF